ncbi:MAG: RNA polymerase sigma factor [Variibacter sp.]
MSVQHAEKLRPAGEAELLARAGARDEMAVRALIRQHNRRLYRLARSILRSDAEAEDALQEAYLRAFTNLAAFRGESSFGTWLARIVINEALGRLRRRRAPLMDLDSVHERPSGEVIPFPLLTDNSDPERTMAQRQILALLEGAIDELPDAFRTVLIARVIEEMSVEETAQLLDLRPETVKTRLHRARALLKDALEKQIGPMVTEAFPFAGKRCERMADAVVARLGL